MPEMILLAPLDVPAAPPADAIILEPPKEDPKEATVELASVESKNEPTTAETELSAAKVIEFTPVHRRAPAGRNPSALAERRSWKWRVGRRQRQFRRRDGFGRKAV